MTKCLPFIDFSATLYDIALIKSPVPDVLYNSVLFNKVFSNVQSEGPGIDSRCRRGFFPWHMTVPRALGSTQSLKMSTRIILGVKATGA